ncbi:MAG: 4Fe-4S binding protein [Bacteroidales bacterium]|nr:4Fe-4S binding protein [Bacteroidales bacterium]
MERTNRSKLVFTVKNKCRVCYTCVRECPAKAIKIINGQAEVLDERCIGCGNCVKVCSQGAKVFLETKDEVRALLNSNDLVIACVAPSFPAEFTEISDHRILVSLIRKIGFGKVVEVSFGADMVAKEYKKLFNNNGNKTCITSDCPAIVSYIKIYHPEMVSSLAPIVSPMVAITRIAKAKYGENAKIVFIGPCLAKKAESVEVDEILTFKELREMFNEQGLTTKNVEPTEFDPPFSGKGAIFPVSRGLLHTINKSDDISEGNTIVAEGKNNFIAAINEFEKNKIYSQHLELLCCEGCIMGPGMTKPDERYSKRTCISNYVKEKLNNLDVEQWEKDIKEFSNIDLSRTFKVENIKINKPGEEEIAKVLLSMGKKEPKDHLNCRACGYQTCREHAIAIIEGLAESEMCLPYTIEKLHDSINSLNISNENLSTAQQALKQSEKLAHMGQLSAGIAHELNNPLGVITMYSNILKEEAKSDDPIIEDLELIVEQAERCKGIVGGLLNFARKNQVKPSEANIENFTKHSIDSIIKPNNISISFSSEMNDPIAMFDKDQLMQVLTNLEKNAVEAMPNGGELKIFITDTDDEIEINVSDTGTGISKENMDKLFTPFFTTKKPGKGTGLGLPLIYGIVKMHKGQISVQSNDDAEKGETGTNFKIKIPRIINNS